MKSVKKEIRDGMSYFPEVSDRVRAELSWVWRSAQMKGNYLVYAEFSRDSHSFRGVIREELEEIWQKN